MTGPPASLHLHPDRLLPADPGTRAVARQLYTAVRDLPIISPHGHVDAGLLAADEAFPDPATLLVTHDHYVTRLLHAAGVGLDALGVGQDHLTEATSRAVWRELCGHWPVFAGTPVRYWLEWTLSEVFGVDVRPSAATADPIYDRVAACLTRPEFRPRSLFARFDIEVLATTDDPADALSGHETLAADPGWSGRVIPTFRPDRYLEPERPDWPGHVARLGEAAGEDTGDYAGYLRALAGRRRFFREHGSVSADHSHADAGTAPLPPHEAERIYAAALQGAANGSEAVAFRRHMMTEMARMSTEDGLVMTLHPGVRRNHHAPTFERYGPDSGHDIPVRTGFTDALRPLLHRHGTDPGLHLVVFTVDETTWSRELAPLAGFYPTVYVGEPWWFLDAPEAIRRFRAAVTETVGFTRTSGFIDDTRAFCSIPARHDMARRLNSGYLAQLVVEHRLDEEEAAQIAVDLTTTLPRHVFKL